MARGNKPTNDTLVGAERGDPSYTFCVRVCTRLLSGVMRTITGGTRRWRGSKEKKEGKMKEKKKNEKGDLKGGLANGS